MGHFKKANVSPKKKLVEFRDFGGEFSLGDSPLLLKFLRGVNMLMLLELQREKDFKELLKDITLEGVGDATHGQRNRMRAPCSIGAASYPARVFNECEWLVKWVIIE